MNCVLCYRYALLVALKYVLDLKLMPIARIVVTLFNSDDDIDKCLQALSLQTRLDFEVVLANNNAEDITLEDYHYPNLALSIVNSLDNVGFSGGSNLGAKGALTDWIVTLNPDAWPYPDWFEKLMQAGQNNPEYVMLSSTLLNARHPEILDGVGDAYSIFGIGWRGAQGRALKDIHPENMDVLAPCGAAAAYRRVEFEDIDGFDETYFCYLEDLDIAIRLQAVGHKCLHIFEAFVLHKGSGSTEESSQVQLYYSYKNQLLLMIKLVPIPLLVIMLPLYFMAQIWILLRTRKQKNWASRLDGLKQSLKNVPQYIHARHQKKYKKRYTTRAFAQMIYWSPLAVREKRYTRIRDA